MRTRAVWDNYQSVASKILASPLPKSIKEKDLEEARQDITGKKGL